jgi:hypothetical protein
MFHALDPSIRWAASAAADGSYFSESTIGPISTTDNPPIVELKLDALAPRLHGRIDTLQADIIDGQAAELRLLIPLGPLQPGVKTVQLYGSASLRSDGSFIAYCDGKLRVRDEILLRMVLPNGERLQFSGIVQLQTDGNCGSLDYYCDALRLTASVPGGGYVSGTVRGSDHRPIQGASIQRRSVSIGDVGRWEDTGVHTDPLGEFRLQGVPEDSWIDLRVVSNAVFGTPARVRVGDAPIQLLFDGSMSGCIVGLVTLPNVVEASDVSAFARRIDRQPVTPEALPLPQFHHQTQCDGSGFFEISGVSAGVWEVEISWKGRSLGSAGSVLVESGSTAALRDLNAEPLIPTISLSVLNMLGDGVRNPEVIWTETGHEFFYVGDDNGRVTMPLPERAQRVAVCASDAALAVIVSPEDGDVVRLPLGVRCRVPWPQELEGVPPIGRLSVDLQIDTEDPLVARAGSLALLGDWGEAFDFIAPIPGRYKIICAIKEFEGRRWTVVSQSGATVDIEPIAGVVRFALPIDRGAVRSIR